MNRREIVREYMNAFNNPFNEKFLELRGGDVKYCHEQTIELCEELEKRYKFAVGVRVQMTQNLLDEEDRGGGWDYHAGHFLCTWNVGTVVEISHIKNGEIYVMVQWDFQPTRDGKKNENGKFPWSEKKLKLATLKSAKIPKKFKCPDIDKKEKEKKSRLKEYEEAIKKAEDELKKFLKEEVE